MSDIVARLRSPEVFIDAGWMTSPVALLAADEIERLRKERDRLRDALLALTIHEEAASRREGLEPCHEAQEARWLLNGGRYESDRRPNRYRRHGRRHGH
jgi:hypothetical protein